MRFLPGLISGKSGYGRLMRKNNKNNKKSFINRAGRVLNIREMKRHKAKTVFYFVMRFIIIFTFVMCIVNGNWENAMTCFLTFILLMIPSFLESKMKIDLPNIMEIIVIVFVFAANIMGEIGAFYEKIPMWDVFLHAFNGFICAGVGFGLIDILNQNEKIKFNLSPIFVCLFSFCFSMTAGTVWEFFEFGADMFLGKDMQKDTIINSINTVVLSGGTNDVTKITGITDTMINGKSLGINGYLDIGLLDTMKDLLVNFAGAIVFNVLGYFYIINRGKKADFIANFIPRRIKNIEEHKFNKT